MSAKYKQRFRLHSIRHHDEVGRFASIEDVVKHTKHYDLAADSYILEDKQEDSEIHLEELIEAWNRGERPLDLSMF